MLMLISPPRLLQRSGERSFPALKVESDVPLFKRAFAAVGCSSWESTSGAGICCFFCDQRREGQTFLKLKILYTVGIL